MTRQPAVADRFYPGDRRTLQHTVAEMLAKFSPEKRNNVYGVVSPHAGYIYSGDACAETLKAVEIPDTVILLGPNHHGRGSTVALSKSTWAMPMGNVPVNEPLADAILHHCSMVQSDDFAHQYEHSLEVQIPFLQALQKNLSIVPIALSFLEYQACQHLGECLATAISEFDKPVLMVASSDMSHYETRESATKKDTLALARFTDLDPSGMYDTVVGNNISMCGIIPVTVVLHASLQLGANTAEIIRYTDSGAVSGDTDQVVGYAGGVIFRS